ncbi:MAG: hypothetical protein JW993_07900 [Sedimentisphaerales bacterium]|nr:hypothetical protein [Sedimentisphaerales bacterium]
MQGRRAVLLCVTAVAIRGSAWAEMRGSDTSAEPPTVESLLKAVRRAARPAESMRIEWTYETVNPSVAVPGRPGREPPPGPPHTTMAHTAILKGKRSRIESLQKTYKSISSEGPHDVRRITRVFDGKQQRNLTDRIKGALTVPRGWRAGDPNDRNSALLTQLLLAWPYD